MVLLWRQDVERTRIFNGEGDVVMFFFYFENVALLGKKDSEKSFEILQSFELLAHLDGHTFGFFFQRFTTNGNLIEEARSIPVVKDDYLGEFQKIDKLEEIIPRATETSLSTDELKKTINNIDEIYGKGGFNKE